MGGKVFIGQVLLIVYIYSFIYISFFLSFSTLLER